MRCHAKNAPFSSHNTKYGDVAEAAEAGVFGGEARARWAEGGSAACKAFQPLVQHGGPRAFNHDFFVQKSSTIKFWYGAGTL